MRELIYCDSCKIYLNDKGEMSKNLGALKQKINTRLVNGEIVKANDRD